jgi:uncharacterized membrane protein
MTAAHLHLLLNHIPVLGTFFGLILLFLGLTKRSKTLQIAGLATFFIVGLVTIPAYLTGEAAEHATEHLSGSSHDMLHEHEELGLYGFIISLILGMISGFFWFLVTRNRHLHYKKALWAILIASLFSFFVMVLIGGHGGKIRRPELRSEIQEVEHTSSLYYFDRD